MTMQQSILYTTDAGNAVHFNSEGAYEAAVEWYNATPKSDIIGYCKNQGINIFETNGKKLVDDWADIAMELWARTANQ